MHRMKQIENDSGTSAVEFAIVLPVLLTIVCGILAYGSYIGASHSIAQLAADGARASVAGLSDGERAKIAADHIQNSAKNYFMISPEKVIVTTANSQTSADIFEVVVAYDASELPIWGLDGLVPLPSKQITRTASIRRGGQ